MKKTFEGPSSGPGSIYSWSGNSRAGEGRMTIAASQPNELVSMSLKFTRPFKCTNEVNFVLGPTEGGTQVSWIMTGKNNFMAKVFSLLINMDKMVGKEFEEGLGNLNKVAQAEAQKQRQSV